jgi:hypothetical protein
VSFIFDINQETVWSPALRAGQVYVGYAQALADVLKSQTGFSFNGEDFVNIDPDSFRDLVERMRETLESTNHRVLTDLICPVYAPSRVMLERAGVDLEPDDDPVRAQLIDEIRQTMAQ